jgi:hypothetical protein
LKPSCSLKQFLAATVYEAAMLRFLIGPILLCAGYGVGSYIGADAEQLVRKPPSQTYAVVEQALANIRQKGKTSFDGGTPMPYELHIDRTLDQKLIITLDFNGQMGAETDIDFTPRDGGASTLIAARIHADRNVLRPALAGTSQARMAYAPNWMLNLTFKPVLRQLASQIEQGETATFQGLDDDAQAQWESSLSDDQRRQVAEWRQFDATRPSTDPDAAANQFMERGNSSSN